MPCYLAFASGLCRGAVVNRMTPETPERCEGCPNPATTADSEGVPLCDDCAASMLEDYEKERAEKLKNKESQ